MPRIDIEIDNLDSNLNVTRYDRNIWGRYLKLIDGNWGLIEFTFPVAAGEAIGLAIYPGKIKHDITIDDLLIRKTGTDIYGNIEGKGRILNNRFYPARLFK